MATGVNKAILIGNLGSDPEIRNTQSGSSVCNFSIATSESWRDKQTGEKVETTEWHRIVAFNRLAEIMGEYLQKGSKVYIEGKIQTRKWQDQNGQDRWTTEIVARDMQMLGGNERQTNSPQQQGSGDAPAGPPANQGQGSTVEDDDIPF